MKTRRQILRPKDVLKEYLRAGRLHDEDHGEIYYLLYDFVYWMEGQDLLGDDDLLGECRYHVVPAAESMCPFQVPEADESEETPK